tara:strand:+ start:133 stop:651 length:519 start_codon:yes stop_codon:yes gene_type:complete
MILNCNSCEKKFVVPDKAITAVGRVVQCGSCGNKWKQFPIENIIKKSNFDNKIISKKTTNSPKVIKNKKRKAKKTREIDLYSPEYLAKKHGIHLNNTKLKTTEKNDTSKKISFGFYNSLILFIVIIITFSRGLYFLQDIIIQKIPLTEFYLNYFFENIRNIFEIFKNLVSSY